VDKGASPRRFLVLRRGDSQPLRWVLASLGIYAVISFSVSQRVQEIGIRMALGSIRGQPAKPHRAPDSWVGGGGSGVGNGRCASLPERAGSLLYGVTSSDPATFFAMGMLLTGVAAAAGLYSGVEGIADRSDGCVAIELKGREFEAPLITSNPRP
jgi:hypothetical protein